MVLPHLHARRHSNGSPPVFPFTGRFTSADSAALEPSPARCFPSLSSLPSFFFFICGASVSSPLSLVTAGMKQDQGASHILPLPLHKHTNISKSASLRRATQTVMLHRLIVVLMLTAKCHLMSYTQLLILFNGRKFRPKGLCQLLIRLSHLVNS